VPLTGGLFWTLWRSRRIKSLTNGNTDYR
jgi:hypothetical protein